MPADGLVSVVTPVRDGARYLAEALESVLSQTHRQVESIVVDDGSKDRSAAIAQGLDPRVRVVSQPPTGEAAARNHGVSLARGEYIAFIDSDDFWEPNKLELQLESFADPTVDLVFTHQRQFRSPELKESEMRFVGEGEVQAATNTGTLLVSRPTFERVGPFADWRIGLFLEWLGRARDLGLREEIRPEALLHRRLHPRSQTVTNSAHMRDYARILKQTLDRRRASR